MILVVGVMEGGGSGNECLTPMASRCSCVSPSGVVGWLVVVCVVGSVRRKS